MYFYHAGGQCVIAFLRRCAVIRAVCMSFLIALHYCGSLEIYVGICEFFVNLVPIKYESAAVVRKIKIV